MAGVMHEADHAYPIGEPGDKTDWLPMYHP